MIYVCISYTLTNNPSSAENATNTIIDEGKTLKAISKVAFLLCTKPLNPLQNHTSLTTEPH